MTLLEHSGLTVKKACYLILRLPLYSVAFSIPLVFGEELISTYFGHPLLSSILMLLVYAIPFLLVIKVGLKWINKDLFSDAKEEFSRIDYSVLFLVIILTPFIGIQHEALTSNVLPAPPEYLNEIFKDLIKPNIISFLSIAVAPAILEEVLCRGIILDGLLKRYSPSKAIIWSAFLFGAMHLNPWQFITGLLIGLFIRWIYYRTKSILPGIMIHFVNNSIAYFMWLTWGDEITSLEELMTTSTYYILVAVSLVLCIAGIWYLNKRMPKEPDVTLNQYSEAKAYI